MSLGPHGHDRAFFGRRKGHPLRDRQAELIATRLPSLAVRLDGHILDRGSIDPGALFGAPRSGLRLEIGFGGGEHLLARATQAQDVGFIGVEGYLNGVAKVVAVIEARGLTNIRLHHGDAADLLAALPASCLDQVDLLYPDPWPKRRQQKRRFIDDARLAAIAHVLKPGGRLHFATDIDDYAAWTLARAARSTDLVWTAQSARDWLTPWPDWPGTRYEAKALRAGRRPIYLSFARR